MSINGNYNNVNTNYRITESKSVHNKQCKCDNQSKQNQNNNNNVDTFERSTPQDAVYANYADTYHQYVQAVYSALYNQKIEPLTPNDELKIEASEDKHSFVEKTSASCPTHNNEKHSYNQEDQNESNAKNDEEA